MRRLVALAAALVLALSVAPAVSADEHGTNRPIWSNVSGEVNFYLVGEPGVDPCPVVAVSDAYGTMTHVGKVWVHWQHCSPVTLPVHTNMHITITAANGDTLIGTYEVDGEEPLALDITAGTGRFAGATGHLHYTFVLEGEWADDFPVNPWHGWWKIRGTISY